MPNTPQEPPTTAPAVDLPRVLTAEEVATVLRVPTARVYEMARLEAIPSIRMRRQVRFLESALRDWLERGGTQ